MKKTTKQLYEERLLKVLVYIQQHLDDTLHLEDLAGLAHFSPYHFHRIFRGMVGESLQEHIRRLRLERAAMRLKHSKLGILPIALEAGYETHEAFTRAFGVLFGCSPSQYRAGARIELHPSRVHYQVRGTLKTFTLVTGDSTMNVEVKTLEPIHVAFVRHVGPYSEVGKAWETICMYLGKEGWLGPDAQFIGVCYDNPEVTPADKIRYDACVTVGPEFQAEGPVGVQVLAGGAYGVTTHEGPYAKLNETYARLYGQWLPQSTYDLRSEPSLEFYLNDPNSTQPEDLLTDIYTPITPVK